MTKSENCRKKWGKDEKIFFCKMLRTPLATGHPKTVSEISSEYGISAKLLYSWQAVYIEKGEGGFGKEPRKVYNSKSKDSKLAESLCSISTLHPDWSAEKFIDALKLEDPHLNTPTIPTVLKVLRENHLGTSEQRFGAAERLFVEGATPISEKLIHLLAKQNPYLRLLEFNQKIDGFIVLVKSIPLSRYFKGSKESLFIAIEANSLMMFGRTWNGKDLADMQDLISSVIGFLQGPRKVKVFLIADENSVLQKIDAQVGWLGTNTNGIDRTIYFDAIKPQFNAIRRFLRHHNFQDDSKLHADLDEYIKNHIFSNRNLGYPNFGESPFYTVKNYRETLYFNSLKK